MNDKKELAKLVLYILVFGDLLPDNTPIKIVRERAIKITKGMTNNFTKKGGGNK